MVRTFTNALFFGLCIGLATVVFGLLTQPAADTPYLAALLDVATTVGIVAAVSILVLGALIKRK